MRDIPDFDLGYVTNGAGDPVDDRAIAYSEYAGIERELELQGEGASDLMPLIVRALNSYDQTTAALRMAEAVMAKSIMPKPDAAPDHPWSVLLAVRAAIARAEGAA